MVRRCRPSLENFNTCASAGGGGGGGFSAPPRPAPAAGGAPPRPRPPAGAASIPAAVIHTFPFASTVMPPGVVGHGYVELGPPQLAINLPAGSYFSTNGADMQQTLELG